MWRGARGRWLSVEDKERASAHNRSPFMIHGPLMARSDIPALEPFYYLKNFELVLATIGARYADLLSSEESLFVSEFSQVPLTSRALLTRMVMRRGDLFRASKLNYAEIGDPARAAGPLVERGWVDDGAVLVVEQVGSILTKLELIRCFGLPARYAGWRKEALVAALKAQFTEARAFAGWCAGLEDRVYALRVSALCERFRVMFFGNHRQTWSEFVTADLKIFNYEKVERALHSRAFQTRAQIDVFLRLQECRELLEVGMPLEDLVAIVPPAIEDSDWLEDRRQQLIFSVAREFERAGEAAVALSMYGTCSHRGARARAMRLHGRRHAWAAAHALCLEATRLPESEAEMQLVRRLLPRATRQLGLEGDCALGLSDGGSAVSGSAPAPAPIIPQFEVVFDGVAESARHVEYLVRDHLAREVVDRRTVRYVENGLVNALFGLLCWRAIFAPVAGAFFHDFHHGPADLASRDFRRRREREFQDCLALLESTQYRQSIWKTFREKGGIQSPFVNWRAIDGTVLGWALDCFPAKHLRLWFEWIVRDVQENRSGFPDLVQFWPEEGRYRMIEVKGPGDRVQDNQRRLLEYCVSHAMPVAVCHVRWGDGGGGGAPRARSLRARGYS